MGETEKRGTADQLKWHLSTNETEIALSDFERTLWHLYHTWARWQEDCQRCASNDDLDANEITLLHMIRMKNRAKTLYELGRILNRVDLSNITYSLRKLAGLGYVKKVNLKVGSKKVTAFALTDKGIKNTDRYKTVRKDICIKLFERAVKIDDPALRHAMQILTTMKMVYDTSSNEASMYGN